AEHLGAPWPDDLYWVDDRDGDMAEIDGEMAGSVSEYVKSRGAVDEKRSRFLQEGARDRGSSPGVEGFAAHWPWVISRLDTEHGRWPLCPCPVVAVQQRANRAAGQVGLCQVGVRGARLEDLVQFRRRAARDQEQERLRREAQLDDLSCELDSA